MTTRKVYLAAVILAAFIAPGSAQAQPRDNRGTDFVVGFARNRDATATQKILLGADAPVTVEVSGPSIATQTVSVSGTGTAMTTVLLPPAAAVQTPNAATAQAIRVRAVGSNAEFTLVGINQQLGTTGAFLGLPIDALGTEYLVAANNGSTVFASQILIAATVDGTSVEIVTPFDALGFTAGTPRTITLNALETFLIEGAIDLTGTRIAATHEVAVFGGTRCGSLSCNDHQVEQIPPVETFRTEWVVTPLGGRTVGDVVRVLAHEADTQVVVDGVLTATLAAGQFRDLIRPSNAPTHLRTSRGALVVQYARGSSVGGNATADAMIIVPAVEQFTSTAVFPVVVGNYDPWINIVMPAAWNGGVFLNGQHPSAIWDPGPDIWQWKSRRMGTGVQRVTTNPPLTFKVGVITYGWGVGEAYGYPGALYLDPVRDTDGDGTPDDLDADDDADGVPDSSDAFPRNAGESVDTDRDGIGNNADEDDDNDGLRDAADPFPLDPNEALDSDGDGLADEGDNCAFIANADQRDTDDDHEGDACDTDDDGDGVTDGTDAFPLDAGEWVDTDRDGTGNNADLDDDNDFVRDAQDAFPLDPAEWLDTDRDGIGNTADRDDDNDGVEDFLDAFPFDPLEWRDSDGDRLGDNADPDDDNDEVPDTIDAFPFDPARALMLTLTPAADTKTVATEQCVAATLRGALDVPVAGVQVRFSVSGSIDLSGMVTTGAAGEATFCYVGPAFPGADEIVAHADYDGDAVVDQAESVASAAKSWLLPEATPGQVTGSGITPGPSAGAEIAFGFNTRADEDSAKGHCHVIDRAAGLRIKCVDATLLVRNGTHVMIFGLADVNGTEEAYRIDVEDVDDLGGNDTFRFQTETGYAVGGVLTRGDIKIR